MELKNRIMMAPMITNLAGGNGEVTEQQIDYYVARAKGGVGLIDVAWACVDRWPNKKVGCLYIDDDEYLRGLEELTSAVHMEGAKIALQISHPGRQISEEETKGNFAVSASDVTCFINGKDVQARALTLSEIGRLIDAFAAGAMRAKSAGFDAVEFHGASGYLIAQFLSPFTNKRTDKYGGDFSGRMKFALDIVKATRAKVGSDFPLIFRISGDEFVEGGTRLSDSKEIAKVLEEAGIDAIHVTAGLLETYHLAMPPMAVPPGCFVALAEGVKEVVDIPVITVGRINDPAFGEEILRNGKADLIALGRAFLSDPEFVTKTAEGKTNEIRKCIACNRCVMRIAQKLHVRCALNACTGLEKRNRLMPTKAPKRVLVIGGGPAGMEAARVASLRGHEVLLFEKKKELGGQLLLSIKAPHKDELKNELEFLSKQLDKLDVKVFLKQAFTEDLVEKFSPDAIILATGAKPCVPNIPGVAGSHVFTAWDVLAERVQVGQRVVVVGGGTVGCETAEFLGGKCDDVTILEMLPELAIDSEPFTRIYLLDRLRSQGIKIITESNVIKVDDHKVIFLDNEGESQYLEVDSVVLATGAVSDNDLALKLKDKVAEFASIGDCVAPRIYGDAIHEAYNAAQRI
jgi:2,4-dienoyl-CoA reductase-like NADH-dependent reductase (Old Yellow Enzyme family)/thioredoxin reductase